MQNDLPHAADFQLAQRCLDRDETTLQVLMSHFRAPTVSYLVDRGAAGSEADEIVGELWADCVQRANGLPGRLLHYDGTCALQTWLNTVAFNRLYSRRRARERDGQVVTRNVDSSTEAAAQVEADRMAGGPDTDFPLISMLRQALEEAFALCSAEEFVILQLAHCDRLRLHELAVIFECQESWMSKQLSRAEDKIAAAVVKYIHARDPWIVLQWSDFLDLCRTATPECLGLD